MTPIPTRSWKMELRFSKGRDPDDGFRRLSRSLDSLDEFLVPVLGLNADGRAELRLVCDEIGSNVVRHSSALQDVKLEIRADADARSVRLRIADDGDAFNPFLLDAPDLGAELDDRRVGGLGLFLVRQLFPLASYQRDGGQNVVEVEFVLGKDGPKKMRRRSDTREMMRKHFSKKTI